MTYSSDFLLFYAYAAALCSALLLSVLVLVAEAAGGSFRQWRARRRLPMPKQDADGYAAQAMPRPH